MIHPHYDLLTQNSHVMNPNFIHPPPPTHPFFQFHQFPTNNVVTTTRLPLPTQKGIIPAIISTTLRTTQKPLTITTPTLSTTLSTILSTTEESPKIPDKSSIVEKTNTTRAPQASKPIVESVKTYTFENESDQKQQMPLLSTLEKMDTSNKEVRKAQNFPTPSSTILPTAQQIDNQTSTTMLTSIVSTTTISQQTTNLPKKISEVAEKAALNGVFIFEPLFLSKIFLSTNSKCIMNSGKTRLISSFKHK